jgi:hypothetical protein
MLCSQTLVVAALLVGIGCSLPPPPAARAEQARSAALPPEPPLQPNPLEGVASALRAFASAAAPVTPTGFTKQTYLATITGVVNWFLPFQNATTGAIIDPATHEEMEYATPCWVSLFDAKPPRAPNRPPPPKKAKPIPNPYS